MGKPMFNALRVSAHMKTKEGEVHIANPQMWAIQKVLEVGPNVQSVQVGDVILLNTSNLDKTAFPLKVKNVESLLISERDILYIYDSEDVAELPNKEVLS
jgi:hypothetical protein